MEFEWDDQKAASNTGKHQVTFEEASTVFDDSFFISFRDDEHSRDEDRFITIGTSLFGRVLMVAHTDRDDRIRIISARKATSNERRFYADGLTV